MSDEAAGERRRPALSADVARLAREAGTGDPYAKVELAHATAEAVVQAGRGAASHTDLTRLVDAVGLDTLAELWQDSAPDSLPGALWALYLLQTWCSRNGEQVARLYRAGRAFAPVDEVVAGVADSAESEHLQQLTTTILSGAYGGDFALALDRAASFFRIISLGREVLAADGESEELRRAGANLDRAVALASAGRAWRSGELR